MLLLALILSTSVQAAAPRKARPRRAAGAPAACARMRFDLGGPLPLNSAQAGVVADFDGDGNADFAVFDLTGMRIFLGNGAGGFQPGPPFTAGLGASVMVAGDYDEDGHPDLVTTDLNGLDIFLGDGAGGFAAGDPIPPIGAGGVPIRLAAGDFNGDGHLDFVELNDAGAQVFVTVALGDGAGHFAGQATAGSGQFPISLAAADFDGDGKLDVVVTLREGFEILLGDGNGGLGTPLFVDTAGQPGRPGVGDFDGDGKLDLALPLAQPDSVSVYLGLGNGSFGPPQAFPSDFGPHIAAVADWDGDGKLDLGIVSNIDCDLTILKGDGLGGFALVAPSKFIATNPVNDLELGDFDHDGVADVLVFSQIASSLLLADGAGGFRSDRITLAGGDPFAVAAADFDGDGHLDLATANNQTDEVAVLFGDGAGGFGPPVTHPAGAQPLGIVAGDFDEDGHPDLAVTDFAVNTVSVLLNDGHGAFGPPQSLAVGAAPWGLTAADFNGDGHLDLAIANSESGDVSIRLGDGHGNFAGGTSVVAGAFPRAVLAADLNGDGKADLVAAGFGGLPMSVWLGNGDGTFGPRADFTAPFDGHSLAVGDVDENGSPDIALGMNEFGATLFLNDGQGHFTPQGITYVFGSFIGGVDLADFDGDGHLDLAGTNTDFSNFGIYLGDGTGGFGAVGGFGYGTGGVPSSILAADFDEDGRPDIAITAFSAGGVTVLLNRSFTVLPPALPQPQLQIPYSATVSALGGTAPVTLALSGALPAGLAFDAAAATISGIPTEVGTFPITVTATDAGGCSASRRYVLTVAGTRTLIVVTSSSSHSIFGETVTLTATVTTDPPGSDPPTGTVTFTIDGVAQSPVPLVAGMATLTVENLSVGTHTVTASYSGDATHASSTSAAFPQIVLAAAVPALGLPAVALLGLLLAVAGARLVRQ
jgi:hypothetical protein